MLGTDDDLVWTLKISSDPLSKSSPKSGMMMMMMLIIMTSLSRLSLESKINFKTGLSRSYFYNSNHQFQFQIQINRTENRKGGEEGNSERHPEAKLLQILLSIV